MNKLNWLQRRRQRKLITDTGNSSYHQVPPLPKYRVGGHIRQVEDVHLPDGSSHSHSHSMNYQLDLTNPFEKILSELAQTHRKKSQDYGTDNDPYANVRASKEYGVEPWVGSLIRENDKTTRIKSFCKKGWLANESLEDSLLDKAVYSIIALLLYREAGKGGH